ncbi:MAG: 7-carboxy-7-deazaguanine synthase QueE [Flavobacteriia bacterium]|nr:7-carboxy-7-deazaguanine synthase QueE [Flavobacteriia bacterium]
MEIKEVNADQGLPIMEHFFTIQGEGTYSGRAAYFVRLAGCDIGCVWCDVKESWDSELHPILGIDYLVSEIEKTTVDFVVITGGEPALYDLTFLIKKLKILKIDVAIETSGCYELKGIVDWYCFSPKKFKAPCKEAYQLANELKIVINHASDIAWAEKHAEKVKPSCKLYLQPEWSKSDSLLPLIIEFVKSNNKWRISLQTHKFMHIP